MKKRTIILGSLLAVVLMILIPNVSAVEYTTFRSAVNEKIERSITDSLDFKSKLDDLLDKNDVDDSTIRIVGLSLLLTFFLIRRSIDTFIGLILFRLFTIFWFSFMSVLNSISSGESIIQILIRFIAGFIFGIICPIFMVTTGLNLLIFAKIVGPIATITSRIYTLAMV